MKKLILLLGCMRLLAFATVGCRRWGKLELPFLSEDITRIELQRLLKISLLPMRNNLQIDQ